MQVPTAAELQRKAALERANLLKKAKKLAVQNISAGSHAEGLRVVADMLENVTEDTAPFRVDGLLMAIHKWGSGHTGTTGPLLADQVLRKVGVNRAQPRLRDLTERQRVALAAILRGMAIK